MLGAQRLTGGTADIPPLNPLAITPLEGQMV